jgi:cobalt-zinc-cadmium efflux system protein
VKLKPIETLIELNEIKTEIKKLLKAYPFSHYTIEIESDQEECMMNP